MTKKNKTLLITALLFVIQTMVGSGLCLAGVVADKGVVATGRDFLVTKADVEKVKEYYNRTPIRTVEAEYQVVTLNLLLFVHDAIALHLDKGINVPPEGSGSVEYWVLLSDAYWKHIVSEYPVSYQVIESYYRVFPERFQKSDNETPLTECRAVDRKTADKIRMLIINRKKSDIYQDVVSELRSKYSVKTVGFK